MSIAESVNALVKVDEYKLFSGIGSSDNSDDNQIQFFINSCSEKIQGSSGTARRFREATLLETFSGDGTSSRYLNNAPITAVTKLEQWNGSAWVELPLANYPYTFDDSVGNLYFQSGSNCYFSRGFKNYRVTYTYGYVIASIPADLKEICCKLVSRAIQLAHQNKEGLNSESTGESTTSYNLGDWSSEIKMILQGYRRKFI